MKELLRKIPNMDVLLNYDEIQKLEETYGRTLLLEALRKSTDKLREAIRLDKKVETPFIEWLADEAKYYCQNKENLNLRRVLNGTGVLLHTNLGRAPLSKKAIEAMVSVAENYSNLELNLETGKRGSRYEHLTDLLIELTGCEDALIVNNNASAVLLILSALCKEKEAIVSRGELVEIGGSFRMPDVMSLSGAYLKEVGTTNKTHNKDYEQNINENTGLLVKVHRSNFAIRGFTESVELESLCAIGNNHQVPVYYDLGSGSLVDLEAFGIMDEPPIQKLMKTGVDLLSFSGDKILGGTQAGIIIGKKALIEKLKEHQLLRAFRVDKLTLAGLEATLRSYLTPEKVWSEIPSLRLISEEQGRIKERANKLHNLITPLLKNVKVTVIETTAFVGGGSLPDLTFPSWAVALEFNEEKMCVLLHERLRQGTPSLMARLQKSQLIIDLRGIEDTSLVAVSQLIKKTWEDL